MKPVTEFTIEDHPAKKKIVAASDTIKDQVRDHFANDLKRIRNKRMISFDTRRNQT